MLNEIRGAVMTKDIVKKIIIYTLNLLYGLISLLYCYVFAQTLIFALSDIRIGLNGLETKIPDIHTLLSQLTNVFGCLLPVLFILLSVTTIILLIISTFKKHKSPIINIFLCVFVSLLLIAFELIPPQVYIIALYILVQKISFLKYSRLFYILLSVAVLVVNAFALIKKQEAI